MLIDYEMNSTTWVNVASEIDFEMSSSKSNILICNFNDDKC